MAGRWSRDHDRCTGWGQPDDPHPCETPRLPHFRLGRCARCAELHRLHGRQHRDPWPSINDLALPSDPEDVEARARPRQRQAQQAPAGSFAARRAARADGRNRRREDETRLEDRQP